MKHAIALITVLLLTGCSKPEPKYHTGDVVCLKAVGETVVIGNHCQLGVDACKVDLLFKSVETRYIKTTVQLQLSVNNHAILTKFGIE